MDNPAYQTVYNVGLLDDIHNYFPALLYDQGRFQTLPNVFSYVRNQMNTRFNLYSYGASLAGARVQPTEMPNSVPAPTMEEDILTSMASINLLLNLIQPASFVPASRIIRTQPRNGADIWADFRSPVIVAPTQEIIAANTQIIMGSDLPSNTVCSICQDSIIDIDSCRRITSCQHVYHKICIDQWFTRSVICPSCRHDIRNSSPRLPTIPSPPSPPTT